MNKVIEPTDKEIVDTARRIAHSNVTDTTFLGQKIKFWGRVFERIPFGSETTPCRFHGDIAVGVCHDCDRSLGGLHQPGCGAEECPRCHTQLLSCFCGLWVRAEVTVRAQQKTCAARASRLTQEMRRRWELRVPSPIDFDEAASD